MKTNFTKCWQTWTLIAISLPFMLLSVTAQAQKKAPEMYLNSRNSHPLLFMENKGQVMDMKGQARPDIFFTAKSNGLNLYLSSTGICYQFMKVEKKHLPDTDNISSAETGKITSHMFTMRLEGSNPNPAIVADKQNGYFENYFLAHFPAGIKGVRSFERVIYKDVYPGIDWVIYSKGSFLEYDFIVHEGADASKIKINIKDADKYSLSKDGSLIVHTSLGEIKEKPPVSFSPDGRIVKTKFIRHGDGTIGFGIPDEYKGKALRIDPEVAWSTFYGGSGTDEGHSCSADSEGNIFMAGTTSSSAGIATAGLDTTNEGNSDAFLVKFNSSGVRQWATYYGGTGLDIANQCVVSSSGNIYISGTTGSSGIAFNGFQNTFGGSTRDLFYACFNDSGTLIRASYYGGTSSENGGYCAIDANENVYLVGSATNTGLASGGHQNTPGGSTDGILVKFDSSGNRVWATYYGGTATDEIASCAIDSQGNIYIGGTTGSTTGIATSGAYKTTYSGFQNGFFVKFNSSGTRQWGTYYGVENGTRISGCTVDPNDDNIIYFTGFGSSITGIAENGYRNTISGSIDSFLVRFDSSGSRTWGTYFGNDVPAAADRSYSCSVAESGNVYIMGYTESGSGIVVDDPESGFGGAYDAYAAGFTADGGYLWASFFGGTGYDMGFQGCVDNAGNVYLVGSVAAGETVTGPHQTVHGGLTDAFLIKFAADTCTTPAPIAEDQEICAGSTFADAVAVGVGLKWYASAESETPLPISTIVETGTYYLSQTDGCESIRIEVTLTTYTCYPVTQISEEYCGAEVSLNEIFTADAVDNAQNYRFRVSDGVNVQTRVRPDNMFSLNMLASYMYDTSYTVDVSVKIDDLWGEYGPACTIISTDSPQTQLASEYCNSTISDFSTNISANPVPLAEQYRFRVSDGNSTQVIIRDNQTFRINLFSGYTYGTVYTVEVAVKINGAWGNYGPACTLTTPTVPVTQLQPAYCGSTVESFASYVYAEAVPLATQYRFRVSEGANTEVIVRDNKSFRINLLSSYNYNTEYDIEVAALIDGNWGDYGPVCTITTPAIQTTQLEEQYCGTTVSGLDTSLFAVSVPLADRYRFRISDGLTTTVHEKNGRAFRLESAAWTTYNATYTVEVDARIDNIWIGYGAACEVTTPASGARQNLAGNIGCFEPVAFPNPFETSFTFSLNSHSQEKVHIRAFDITGKILENINATAAELQNLNIGANYSSGIYTVIISQGSHIKTIKMVKK